ncbi:MAG: protein phosphatase 2C domain-containing protein [Bacteroidetes bacterium]|nr:protein phosphatase 2C domain-containing protein [Bacteroidota bacterium]
MKAEKIYHLFEVGRKSNQEDYIWPVAGEATENDKVFIVCDGAGKFDNGEIASKLICQFMAAKVLIYPEYKISEELIDKLLIEARERLITYTREYKLNTDLTTTFSMVILYDQKVLTCCFGDSRIFHVRDGEILFKSEDTSEVNELVHHDEMSVDEGGLQLSIKPVLHGIKADESPINAQVRWIDDVRPGDYFLLCSKGLLENVTDDDIKSLLHTNDRENIDLAHSFRELSEGKTIDNYSMYLIRVNVGIQKKNGSNGTKKVSNGTRRGRKQNKGSRTWPMLTLSITVIALLTLFFYLRRSRRPEPVPAFINQTTQPVDVGRRDSVASAISRPAHAASSSTTKDSAKVNPEMPQAIPQNENYIDLGAAAKSAQANQVTKQKSPTAQMRVRFTADESCSLKIVNVSLGDEIDWDISPSDIGTIFLKPGKYSIVATSVSNHAKTKTYQFDVKAGDAHSIQNVHILF